MRSLEGLLALAPGDRWKAESLRSERRRSAANAALRGALLATDSDPHAGARLLADAIRRGAARADLHGWQAEGLVAGGLEDPRSAAEALAALVRLEAARGERLLPAERLLRARALLARDDPEGAAAAMTGIDDPLDPSLRWRVALARATRALTNSELALAAEALQGLPPSHDLEARAELNAPALRTPADTRRGVRAGPGERGAAGSW